MPVDFPATRWSLIARLPEQPQQAGVLLGLYADAVGAYIERKLAGERRELIEDVVQEVLLELMQKPELLARAQPGEGSRFRYFLMELAWSSARNALRRHRRRDGSAAMDAGEPAAPDSQSAMDGAWSLSVVRQALDEVRRDVRLEPDAVRVLELHLVEGRSLRDIAGSTGMSLATCSRRLATMRAALRTAIIERLRLAGEIGPQDDADAAGERLLEALRTQ